MNWQYAPSALGSNTVTGGLHGPQGAEAARASIRLPQLYMASQSPSTSLWCTESSPTQDEGRFSPAVEKSGAAAASLALQVGAQVAGSVPAKKRRAAPS